jgi:hypothetical protein
MHSIRHAIIADNDGGLKIGNVRQAAVHDA